MATISSEISKLKSCLLFVFICIVCINMFTKEHYKNNSVVKIYRRHKKYQSNIKVKTYHPQN